MSIISKIFKFDNTDLSVLKTDTDIWFKGKAVAEILGYANTRKAIRDHIDDEDKRIRSQFEGGNETFRHAEDPQTIFINESGLYSLIMRSKLDKVKEFKRWVTKEVLPSIRKTGTYSMNHKFSSKLTFNIQTEFDLHTKVVQFIKKRFPDSLFTATLGENQDTTQKRIKSFNQGYLKGSPDLVINNLHKSYTGFAIEFKSPKGTGTISQEQTNMLKAYERNGFKTLISNDYDEIIERLIEYFKDVRIKCQYCSNTYKTSDSLLKHHQYFHKIKQ